MSNNNIWGGIDYNNTKRIINLKSQVDSMQMEQQNLIEMMPTKADVTYVDEKHTEMQDLLAESEVTTDTRLDGIDATLLTKENTTAVDTKLAGKLDKSGGTVTGTLNLNGSTYAGAFYLNGNQTGKVLYTAANSNVSSSSVNHSDMVSAVGGNFTNPLKINPTNTASDKIIFSNGTGGTYSGHKIVQTANSLDEYIPNGSRNQWYITSADGSTRTLAFSISGDTGNVAFTNGVNIPSGTADRVMVTDGSKYAVTSTIKHSEVLALAGITGNVQTRLNAVETATSGVSKAFKIRHYSGTFEILNNKGINMPSSSGLSIVVPWTTPFATDGAIFTMSFYVDSPSVSPYKMEASAAKNQVEIFIRDAAGNIIDPTTVTDYTIDGRAIL